MGGRIELVVPGLLHLPAHEIDLSRMQVSAPGLHRLLRCADRQPVVARDFDGILLDLLGQPQAALPYAHAWRGAGDQPMQSAAVLMTPVFLKADINNAIIFPAPDLGDEINHIINDLQDYFKVDFTLESIAPGRWLMHLHGCQPVTGLPHYLSALGKKVTHYLEQAKTNLEWFKLFNEIQMFLYQHPVNQRRLQAGEVPVNSLWCWGGDAPAAAKRHYQGWYSDQPELMQLGHLYAERAGSLDEIAHAGALESLLVIDLRLLESLKSGRDDDLVALLERIEQDYLSSLLKGNASNLRLHTGAGIDFSYRRRHDWRFWRTLSWNFPLDQTLEE